MNERWLAALKLAPDYFGQHVLLSAASLALAILLGVPLAIAAGRAPRLRWVLLNAVALIQTIPGLALLALFYPLLLVLSGFSRELFGFGFSALGFLPACLALTLYALLPILRNGIAGLQGVDAAIREAALGVGMTGRQRLLQVELPLAMPVLMAGIRTAAVWVIGTATLATSIGQTSLGNYIFAGLQTEDMVLVLVGCAFAAALALTVDQLLGLIEQGTARRDRRRVVAGVVLLLAGIAATLLLPRLGPAPDAGRRYVVGAKNFSEQYILAELIGARLAGDGASVERRDGLGSTVIFRALAGNEIDAYVEYSGTLWTGLMGQAAGASRAEVLAKTTAWLREKHGVVALGSLGFENAYALAMRRDQADRLGIRTIEDLARLAGDMSIGADLEFLARPEWAALRAAYGLQFREERQFQPTFMYRALGTTGSGRGEVDVISAFSSDGRIAAQDLVILADPKHAIPPYDAMLLVAPGRTGDAAFLAALHPLVGAIPVEAMRQANLAVDRDNDKLAPAEAARRLARTLGIE
jgi:osmoprotectant transport system permease protein